MLWPLGAAGSVAKPLIPVQHRFIPSELYSH